MNHRSTTTVRPSLSARMYGRVEQIVDRVLDAPLRFLTEMGNIFTLLARALSWMIRRPIRAGLWIHQMSEIGVGSIMIIVLVGFFTGAVFGLQSYEAFKIFQAQAYTGTAVSLTLTREIAPVTTSLMVIARAGSAMATELASMKISEQIDALKTIAVSPVQYLVVPRLIASFFMVPALTMIFLACGLFGAYLFVCTLKGVDPGIFMYNIEWYTDLQDMWMGVFKAFVFSIVFTTICCYYGLNASGGAKGVGRATTRAVVVSSVAVLWADYIVTDILIRFHM